MRDNKAMMMLVGLLAIGLLLLSIGICGLANESSEETPVATPDVEVVSTIIHTPQVKDVPETTEEPLNDSIIIEEIQPQEIEEIQPMYSDEELEILAIIIYQEAGGDACSDDTRLMVGNVFLNRVASDDFPDTFYDVATGKAQYGRLYWTGIQWPERAQNPGEAHAVERAYEIAERLLDGERVLPDDVIWQAEFPQGSEVVVEQDGFYFCR